MTLLMMIWMNKKNWRKNKYLLRDSLASSAWFLLVPDKTLADL